MEATDEGRGKLTPLLTPSVSRGVSLPPSWGWVVWLNPTTVLACHVYRPFHRQKNVVVVCVRVYPVKDDPKGMVRRDKIAVENPRRVAHDSMVRITVIYPDHFIPHFDDQRGRLKIELVIVFKISFLMQKVRHLALSWQRIIRSGSQTL